MRISRQIPAAQHATATRHVKTAQHANAVPCLKAVLCVNAAPQVKAALRAALIAILGAGWLLAGAHSASATGNSEYGLAIATSYGPTAVIALPQGAKAPPAQQVTIYNTGQHPAQISFEMSAPAGIHVTPTIDNFLLQPHGRQQVSFGLSVDPGQAPGRYPIIITAQQTNVPLPSGGASRIAPTVGSRLTVKVTGASARLSVHAANEQDHSPISGDMTIKYLSDIQNSVTVANGTGVSQLNATVAPGEYRATFSIAGLVNEQRDFTVKANENKQVEIAIKAVTFVNAGLKPATEDGKIESTDLISSVRNSLPAVDGPITFYTNVYRDGQQIDQVELQTQPSLQSGITSVRESYRPADGFTPGVYTFEFKLKSPKFEITADERPTLTINGSAFPWPIIGALAGLGVIGLLLFLLWRRKRRKKEQEEAALQAAAAQTSAHTHEPNHTQSAISTDQTQVPPEETPHG